jgi:hypothetical protein
MPILGAFYQEGKFFFFVTLAGFFNIVLAVNCMHQLKIFTILISFGQKLALAKGCEKKTAY